MKKKETKKVPNGKVNPEKYKKCHSIGQRFSAGRVGTYKESDMAAIATFTNTWMTSSSSKVRRKNEKSENLSCDKVCSEKTKCCDKKKKRSKLTSQRTDKKNDRSMCKKVRYNDQCVEISKYTKKYKNWFPRDPRIKREASLNASAKTNAMLEIALPKRTKKSESSDLKNENCSVIGNSDSQSEFSMCKGKAEIEKNQETNSTLASNTSQRKNSKPKVAKNVLYKNSGKCQQREISQLTLSNEKATSNSKKQKDIKKQHKNFSLEKKSGDKKKSKTHEDCGNSKVKSRGKRKLKMTECDESCPPPKRLASLNARAILCASNEVVKRIPKDKTLIIAGCARTCNDEFKPIFKCDFRQGKARWVSGLAEGIAESQQEKYFGLSCLLKRIDSPVICVSPDVVHVDDHLPTSQQIFTPIPQKSASQMPGILGSPHHSNSLHQLHPSCAYPYSNTIFPSSNYQSFTIGGLGSLSSCQIMAYHRPYRSAFRVPSYTHPSNEAYQYGIYQSTDTLIQGKHSSACVLPPSLSVQQVTQPSVKVLINNIGTPKTEPINAVIETPKEKQYEERVIIQDKSKLKKCHQSLTEKDGVTRRKSGSSKNNDVKKTDSKFMSKKESQSGNKKKETKIESKERVPTQSAWRWEGQPQTKPVLSLNMDLPPVDRLCYPAIRHDDGDIIRVRDCVLIKSGSRKKDIPFIAKISSFWEHSVSGEMMMSLLWYYRPEHTESEKLPRHISSEIFASKHRDENSVACIEDKCYVLTLSEYCRYYAALKMREEGITSLPQVVPAGEAPLLNTKRFPPLDIDPELVFLCRRVYDYKLKRILKNPMI